MTDPAMHGGLGLLASLFISLLGLALLYIAILFIVDISQNRHAIRRNYPVIGRFRSLFEHLGTFFRQYFFAMDREELPFNRAIRTWVYRASKEKDTSIPFGSTINLSSPGIPTFLHSAYPVLKEDSITSIPPLIGANTPNPYQPHSYFNISGMSYGALSSVAVEALSKGAAKAKCWLNTGEGGLSSFHEQGKCDIVFQIGTALYGVRDNKGYFDENAFIDLAKKEHVKMFELKLSQGAKPGKGGMLPAEKVNAEIAKTRNIPQGEASISPNRHPHINDNTELLHFIQQLKSLSGKPVGIKFVLGNETWFDELCSEIVNAPQDMQPDFIALDGAEGGTGSAPQTHMDFVGTPLQLSLPYVRQCLDKHKLSDHIRLIASGKLVSPAFAAWALCAGADYINSARGFMFSLGCIQALQCNKNTCPTGITTHNERLKKGLDPSVKSERVANYHQQMVTAIETIAHSCGHKSATAFKQKDVRMNALS